jgi:archaemetzincin
MTFIHLIRAQGLDSALLNRLAADLSSYDVAVNVVPGSLNLASFWSEERGQYNSTEILLSLKDRSHAAPRLESSRHCTLCVCEEDLFTPILTFVFGEAELNGDVAVVSSHRLRPEVYGLAADGALLSKRLLKEAVHEVCHCFGLVHCRNPWCVMRSSSDVGQIDLKGVGLCKTCSESLWEQKIVFGGALEGESFGN